LVGISLSSAWGKGWFGDSLDCEVFDPPEHMDSVKICMPLDSSDGPTVFEMVERFMYFKYV
jgi:hypothetical protein